MNRDFFLPRLTPAKARMMVAAARCANVVLSPEIIRRAGDDRLTLDDVGTHLDLDPIGLDICQFISDYQHRCVIPYDFGDQQVYRAIASMVPRDRQVLFITSDPILWVRTMGEKITPFTEKNTDRLQHLTVRDLRPDEMTRARDRYVVANLTPEHVCYEWLGKLFPQMVIYCSMDQQYALQLGGFTNHNSAARHAAAILYPQVVAVVGGDRNLTSRGDHALPLMGCFNRLITAKKKGFRLKKTSADLDDDLATL